MKLLIAGGGTGGHVFPALAIAREWLSRGSEREVVLVGTTRGIEMKLVPQAGLPLETLRVAGLKGKGGSTLLKNLFKLAPAMLDASRVLRKHKPVAAFGVGGYAAGPMLLTTWMRGVPNVILSPTRSRGSPIKLWRAFPSASPPAMKFPRGRGERKRWSPAARCARNFWRLRRALQGSHCGCWSPAEARELCR